jgi:HEAT repeat protein
MARDVCLKDLLAEVARQSDLAVVSHDRLDERVTLEFRDLPLRKAMKRILRDRSFVWLSAQASAGANSSRNARPNMLWVFSKGPRDPAEIAPSNLAVVNEHATARLDAISALADVGGDQAVAVLTAAALSDSDSSVREEAVDALADVGDDTGIHGLEQALTDPEYHVRKAAVEALADIGGDASALALTVALKDREVSLREEAVDALGEIGGQTAIRLLRQAAEDEDEDGSIREAATEYLDELSRGEH